MNLSNLVVGWDFENIWEQVLLNLSMANRHWLISWATWTGKTVTLQILLEQFSKAWVPVFASDVKWDLAGISMPWTINSKVEERLKHIWITDWSAKWFPTVFWDLYWEKWHPIRTTPSDMWPLLLSRLLNLSDTQDALLHVAFKIADDNNWLLLDLDDIESLIWWMDTNSSELITEYWNISSSSIWAIRRSLLVLRESGWDVFFWEPALDLANIMKKDFSGNWVVNVLDASKLMVDARLYSTFLLWLISELFEELPEVWDLDKPKLVFFFDEAHLLFRDASPVLIEKIEQVVRLVRSKWVWIYFITQNPTDIPEVVRSQLWNRFQHALRAFTPKDQKAIKVVAETFRQNPDFEIETALMDMKVWVALVSCLDEKWTPQMVEKTIIRPPESRIWKLEDAERQEVISRSPFLWMYENRIDRESAEEILERINQDIQNQANQEIQAQNEEENKSEFEKFLFWTKKQQWFTQTVWKAIMRKASDKVASKIVRWLLGSLLK